MKNDMPIINVYKAEQKLKRDVLLAASQPKRWFLYTIGYGPPGSQFDNYECRGAFDKMADTLAHWIVLLAIMLAFSSPAYVFWVAFREEKPAPANQP
jgi:hypothetical protein